MLFAHQLAPAKEAVNAQGPWDLLPTLLWWIFAVAVVLIFRKPFEELLRMLAWRLKSGAALKIASFEVGAVEVSPGGGESHFPADNVRKDNGEFDKSRAVIGEEHRTIFLVHRLAPSKRDGQLYDVLLYLVPGLRHGSLAGVKHVEYYFGKYWKQNVYMVIDRASGFSISTSAYAPFTCTARVHFSDGAHVYLHRYVDFEMGPVGRAPLS
jgi:hypothetical protein